VPAACLRVHCTAAVRAFTGTRLLQPEPFRDVLHPFAAKYSHGMRH
jgi:hypothetical protein